MLPGSLITQVERTFTQDSSGPQVGQLEIEIRFGYFRENRQFFNGVSYRAFTRLLEYFTVTGPQRLLPERIQSTDEVMGDIRHTIKPDGTDSWLKKEKIWREDFFSSEYPFRVSASREIPISKPDNFKIQVIRNKDRYSFRLARGQIRLDLTQVTMIDERNEQTTRFEVEIEIKNSGVFERIESFLTTVLLQLFGSEDLYTETERLGIISFVNRLLNPESQQTLSIDSRALVQARNIKFPDLVYGGLIGNQRTVYKVTAKADGVRKLLVFANSGIWMVMAPGEINRVSRLVYPNLVGFILDGELIPLSQRRAGAPTTKYWYLIFDCISSEGNLNGYGDQSVQNLTHTERMGHAQRVSNTFKPANNAPDPITQILTVNTKRFDAFTSPPEFFALMNRYLSILQGLSYQTDGLLFVPDRTPYNPRSDQLYKLYERTLTKVPDICKWKAAVDLTIDLVIVWKATETGINLLELYAGGKGGYEQFLGSNDYPLGNQIKIDDPILTNVPTGTVVEFYWDPKESLLIPRRIRFDKVRPNRIDIALDIWYDIHNPIGPEVIRGESFRLMRKYHNRIKKDLYRSTRGRFLLDIGSGQGGDVNKWRRFEKIIAVEPNEENLVELQRRVQLEGMQDRVRIVNTGGEDTNRIVREIREFFGQRASVISLMLSLSFFWESEELVNSLVNTIVGSLAENGEVIFFTIDGDLVDQTFSPVYNGVAVRVMEFGSSARMDYDPPAVTVNISESNLVQSQVEWLVRLNDLRLRLETRGFKTSEFKRADKELFLTPEESRFTNMFTYGRFVAPTTSYLLRGPAAVPPEMEIPDRLVKRIQRTAAEEVKIAEPTPEIVTVETTEVEVPLVVSERPSAFRRPVTGLSLNPIPVIIQAATDRAIGDDTYEILRVQWFCPRPVVRISCIHDGSSFFHAVLKSFYSPYANTSSYLQRTNIVKLLRRDLAYNLALDDPESEEGLTYFQTTGLEGKGSLESIQKLLNSPQPLDLDLYKYAARMIGIDVYIFRGTTEDLFPLYTTAVAGEGPRDNSVVLLEMASHYELVGVLQERNVEVFRDQLKIVPTGGKRKQLIQSIFKADDPFLTVVRSNFDFV